MSQQPALTGPCSGALLNRMSPALFRALCDPVRIHIVATLAGSKQSLSVGDIASCCGIDFSGVSRHLKVLRKVGVLSACKRGRSVYYALDPREFSASLRGIADALDACGQQGGREPLQ